MDCSIAGFPVLHVLLNLLKLVSIESLMPSSHLILSGPLLLLLSICPSIRLFSSESVLHIRWPKDWTFSFSISPSNEYSGSISFRTDWFHLAVQGTLKSLLQYHSSTASILCCSAFFMVQLSHLYMTTRKTIALTIQTFVGKLCLWFLLHRLALKASWMSNSEVCGSIVLPVSEICESFDRARDKEYKAS